MRGGVVSSEEFRARGGFVRGGVVSSGLIRAHQGSSGLIRAAHRESLELGEGFVPRHEFGRREEEHLMMGASC